MRKANSAAAIFILCVSVLLQSNAQESPQSFLASVTGSARSEHSLSASILLTWKSKTGLKRSSGTIRLMKPNYALIRLSGDYPLVLLVSDGAVRYTAPDQKNYTQEPMDAHGDEINTPWWGFPFRFFFTQSLNPFGAAADPTEHLDSVVTETIDGLKYRVLQVHGTGAMGEYKAEFHFNTENVLERSVVQFGAGAKTGVFEARLSSIRVNVPYIAASFHFVPAAGQNPASMSGGMLALGQQAPNFLLPSPGGEKLTLTELRQGKKATLVNFWYYNCAPCRIEFPEFEKLYEEFRQRGFTIVAVDRGDTAQTVSQYARKAGLTFPIVLGGEFGKQGVFDKYRISEVFPQTYLLDADGRVVFRTAGADIGGIEKELAKLGFH
jgi:peroxiredoxin